MAKEYSRTRRVGDQIQRELAMLIPQQVKDPRIGMVTVTGVEVTREFEQATVYVTVLGDQQARDDSLEGLHQARGYLRHELAKRLKLRTTPELKFTYDVSTEQGNRVAALLNSVSREHTDTSEDHEDRRD